MFRRLLSFALKRKAIDDDDDLPTLPPAKRLAQRLSLDDMPLEILESIVKFVLGESPARCTTASILLVCYAIYAAAERYRRDHWQRLSIRNVERAVELWEIAAFYQIRGQKIRLRSPVLYGETLVYSSNESEFCLLVIFQDPHIGPVLRRQVTRFEWLKGTALPSARLLRLLSPDLRSIMIEWRPFQDYRKLDLDRFTKLDTLITRMYRVGDATNQSAGSSTLADAMLDEENDIGLDWLESALWTRRGCQWAEPPDETWVNSLINDIPPPYWPGEPRTTPPRWAKIKRLEMDQYAESFICIADDLIALGAFERLEYLFLDLTSLMDLEPLIFLSCAGTLKGLGLRCSFKDCNHTALDEDHGELSECSYSQLRHIYDFLRGGRMTALQYFEPDFPRSSDAFESQAFFGFISESPNLANFSQIDKVQRTFVFTHRPGVFRFSRMESWTSASKRPVLARSVSV